MNKNNKSKFNSINNHLITGQGIKTLQGSRWLDDQVINSYFQLISNNKDLNIFLLILVIIRYLKIDEIQTSPIV